jgi:hypothetical protein
MDVEIPYVLRDPLTVYGRFYGFIPRRSASVHASFLIPLYCKYPLRFPGRFYRLDAAAASAGLCFNRLHELPPLYLPWQNRCFSP